MSQGTPAAAPRFMMIAGENSGDLHGAKLIRELKALHPGASFFGFGGYRMEAEGMRLDVNLAQKLPIIGATQVIKNYGKLKALLKQAADMVVNEHPDLLILIDYPGFNLRTAKAAKTAGVPVAFYISPQIWAWHKSRMTIIRDNITKMLVILPFEEKMYREAGVPAVFVGHPLCDEPGEPQPRSETLRALSLPDDAEVIGLVPGSRTSEIVRHLPVMVEAARLIKKERPQACFVLQRAGTVSRELIQKYLDRAPDLEVTVTEHEPKSVRAAMDFAICKSGTSTLEYAIADTPMVIIYKASWLTAFIARRVLSIPHIGLVNIVAEKEVAPELLQENATGHKIAATALAIMNDPTRMATVRADLARVREVLGGPGASRRAAAEISALIPS